MRERIISLILGALIAAGLILCMRAAWGQGDREIPNCRYGECTDDITRGDRAGQPQWCQNHNERGYKANCSCKRSCDHNDRGSDCKTYCRTSKCKCDHGCPMTR